VGIYTEGLLVMDIDLRVHGGGSGFEVLKTLETRFGALPETLRSRTGTGGKHYFFQLAPGVECFKPQTEKLYKVTTRSSGGYVVVPPSPHPSGQNYVWENETCPMAEAPEWLVGLTKRSR
jgi:putative DNA primase/helicase